MPSGRDAPILLRETALPKTDFCRTLRGRPSRAVTPDVAAKSLATIPALGRLPVETLPSLSPPHVCGSSAV